MHYQITAITTIIISTLFHGTITANPIYEGDMVFVEDHGSPFGEAILKTGKATIDWLEKQGVFVSKEKRNDIPNHVALASFDQNGELNFIEALPGIGVVETKAEVFFKRYPNARFFLGRLELEKEATLKATNFAREKLRRPYATLFYGPDVEDRFYCSSLVQYSYRKALGSNQVFIDEPFYLIFSPEEFWRKYYLSMNIKRLPYITGSNPALLLHSPAVKYQALDWD